MHPYDFPSTAFGRALALAFVQKRPLDSIDRFPPLMNLILRLEKAPGGDVVLAAQVVHLEVGLEEL